MLALITQWALNYLDSSMTLPSLDSSLAEENENTGNKYLTSSSPLHLQSFQTQSRHPEKL